VEREKGVAYCGLACSVCGHNETCVGCRNQGCESREWCKNYNCCREKAIEGCWVCDEFPCNDSMLNKVRVRAFAKFIREYGEDKLMDCLESNERNGVVYHYKDSLQGDYDIPVTEDAIIHMILTGEKNK
jgi:hypothetical protein